MITIQQINNRIVFKHDNAEFKNITMNKWSSILAHRANPTAIKMPTILTEIRVLYEQFHEPFDLAALQLSPVQSARTEEPVEDLPTGITFEQVMQYVPSYHKFEYECILCFAASDKYVTNPPWLCTIAPPSNSKSFYYKALNHASISLFVDDMTENSMAAGTASADQEVNSLLDDAEGLNLIMNDMSSIFSQRCEKVRKWLGTLTTSFGGDFAKHSPGSGVVQHNTHITIMMAMTYQSYKQHIKYINDTGNRFFFLFMSRPEYTRYSTEQQFDYEAFKLQSCGLVADSLQLPLPTIAKEVDDYLYEVAHKIIVLRNIAYASSWNGVEGDGRLYQQLQNLCKSRARLHNRMEVLKEDVDFFLKLLWNSVPFQNIIIDIAKNGLLMTGKISNTAKNIAKHTVDLKIGIANETDLTSQICYGKTEKVKIYSFKPDWEAFIKQFEENVEIGDE